MLLEGESVMYIEKVPGRFQLMYTFYWLQGFVSSDTNDIQKPIFYAYLQHENLIFNLEHALLQDSQVDILECPTFVGSADYLVRPFAFLERNKYN